MNSFDIRMLLFYYNQMFNILCYGKSQNRFFRFKLKHKSVLYLPIDHNEGFMMIHTDSAEESISNFARNYIAKLFSIGDYQKPIMRIFAPKCFQDEYKQGAVVKSMSFQTTYVDNQIEDGSPIKDVMGDYDVKISITPRGVGDKSLGVMESIACLSDV